MEQLQDIFYNMEMALNYQLEMFGMENNYYSFVKYTINYIHITISNMDNYFDWYNELLTQNIPKLEFNDFFELERITQMDILRIYYWFVFDSFYEEEKHRIKMGNQFKRSELKSELMATIWHPKNFYKFIYLDADTFDDLNNV